MLARVLSLAAALLLAIASPQAHANARKPQSETARPARVSLEHYASAEIIDATPSRTWEICLVPLKCASTFGVTGYQKDTATGLYYAGARFYDPLLGGFNAMDPAAGIATSPVTFHKYLYANGNPTYYVDPDGREACVGHELANCPMAQYTPNNRSIPQAIAKNALGGVPRLSELADVDDMRASALGPSRHLNTATYRLVPYVDGDNTGVRYYSAQRHDDGSFDYVVPPEQLDTFVRYEEQMSNTAAASRALGGTVGRHGATQRMVNAVLSGDVRGASSAFADSWREAATDPSFYLELGGSVAGGSAARAMRQGKAIIVVESPNGLPPAIKPAGSMTQSQAGLGLDPLPEGVEPYQLKLFPDEVYARRQHYGITPTAEQRASVPPGMEFDHEPVLVRHYYDGPGDGRLPGYNLTPGERKTTAASPSSGRAATPTEQRRQGAEAAKYSKEQKRKWGLDQ